MTTTGYQEYTNGVPEVLAAAAQALTTTLDRLDRGEVTLTPALSRRMNAQARALRNACDSWLIAAAAPGNRAKLDAMRKGG